MPAIKTAYSVNHTAFNGGSLMGMLKLTHGLIGATTLRAVKLTDQVTLQKLLKGFGESMPARACQTTEAAALAWTTRSASGLVTSAGMKRMPRAGWSTNSVLNAPRAR